MKAGNTNIYIRENILEILKTDRTNCDDIYIAPNIPEKKLNNAIKAFGCEEYYETIIAIYDDTLFGSAKEGIIFTGKKMIHHKYGEFMYADIKSAKVNEKIEHNNDGKEKNREEIFILKMKNGNEIYFYDGILWLDKNKFANFINSIANEFDEHKEEIQLMPISSMSEELKISYLKIIVNMTYFDDDTIDEKELSEIFLLMTKTELKSDSILKLREYISEINSEHHENIKNLLNTIKHNSEESQHEYIMISLIKDLINVHSSTKNTLSKDFPFLQKNKHLFGIAEDKINFIYDSIAIEYKISDYASDDHEIKKYIQEISAKAVAAGIPLASVYVSGSVIGLSASGITSGLAALGLGLGMTGGIIAIGILTVFTHDQLKYFTGANSKTKELMLQDVIKQQQKTINQLINDINHIVKKLNDAIVKHNDQTEKIKKLSYMLAKYQGALSNINSKSIKCHESVLNLQIPKKLDVQRLRLLTEDVTKNKLYQFILNNYTNKLIDVDGKKEKQFIVNDNIDTDSLEKMAEIFNTIGYFHADNMIKSKAKNIIDSIIE